MRYLSSTYRVNLPSSRLLDGMTFIPTVTPNTLGNTSVSGLFLWSASQKSMYPVSNATLRSQMARSVMPTGGPMRLYGGRAQLDPQFGPNFQAFSSADFNLLTQKGVVKPGALPFGFTTHYVASSSTTNSIPPRTVSKGHYLTVSVKFPLQRTLDITPSRIDLEGILVTGMVKTVTESLEDQARGDLGAAVLKRISDQKAQILNILPGSTITSAPPGVVMNKICQIPLTYGGSSVRNNTTVYLVNQAGKGFLGMLPGFAEIKGNTSISVRFASVEPGCNILDPQNPQNQFAIYGSQTGLRLANFNPANRGTFSQKPQTWNYVPAPGAEFKPGEELVVTALDPHYPRSYVAKFRVESAPESQIGFVANPLIDMGSGPSDLRLIDLNRDGAKDMVTLHKSAGLLVTQLISNGTLQSAQKLLLQGTPNALDFGFINGDLSPDMVVANDGLSFPGVQVLLGQGNGSFKYDQDVDLGGIKPTRVKLDEFNLSEDDHLDTDNVPVHSKFLPDIAFLSPGSASIGISPRSQDNAAFEVAPLLTVPVSNQPDTTTFGYGDFNSDGRYDLVTGHPNGSVRITWGKLDGSFAPLNEQALLTVGGSDVRDIEVADLNGDCLEEILVAHNNPPGLTVFWQQQTEVPMGSNSCHKGVGEFNAHTYTLSGLVPDRIQFVDIDQNEGVDLALVDSSNGRVGLLKNTTMFDLSHPENQLTSLGVISAGPSLSAVAITDVTADTVPDLLLAYSASDGLGLLKGNAVGSFGVQVPAYPAGSMTQSLALGDLNGDGYLDSVSSGTSGGQNQLVLLKGSTAGLQQVY
ncbi:MAG: VCBS repeat-containing protein [Deinococcaceae bacterium]